MQATGNGRPEICVNNLLSLARGEVPYERLKGLDANFIDAPKTTVRNTVFVDIERTLNIYENRIKINEVDIAGLFEKEGQFSLTAGVDVKEGRILNG